MTFTIDFDLLPGRAGLVGVSWCYTSAMAADDFPFADADVMPADFCVRIGLGLVDVRLGWSWMPTPPKS